MKTLLLILAFLISMGISLAQIPVTNVIYEYAATTNGTSYTHGNFSYKFGKQSGTSNNLQNVVGIIFSGKTFYYNLVIGGHVKIRRVNNQQVSGNRCLVWMESTENSNNVFMNPPYQDSMELILSGRSINRGTDNLFGNQGDNSGNNNNIERVDWMTLSGMKTSSAEESGFAIFERGADNQHDPFCIAAILALDSAGNPSQYGPLLRIASADYGNIAASALNYSILRKEQNEPKLYRSATGNQKQGGVFITFKNLGIDANQVIYGYSLFGSDLPAGTTPANLLSYTNPTYFPLNTSSNTGDGGIDLIAITGLFNSNTTFITLPVKLTGWEVSRQNKEIHLQWQFDNPVYCDHVVVEKSSNGQLWQAIARLPFNRQNFTDPGADEGRYLYRLKIVERDGNIQYSAVKPVIIEKTANARDLQVQYSANKLLLTFPDNCSQPASINISNLNGMELVQQHTQTLNGLNTISLPLANQSGVIIVTVVTDKYRLQKKLLLK
jgi:hypothetical protein